MRQPPTAEITSDPGLSEIDDLYYFDQDTNQIKLAPENPQGEITITANEKTSAYESAKTAINTFLEPIIELETKGVMQNVRAILFGSVVTGRKLPSDIDLIVLYDAIHFDKELELAKAEDDEGLSMSAARRLEDTRAMSLSGHTFKVTEAAKSEAQARFPTPGELHYHVMTTEEFLRLYNEPDVAGKTNADVFRVKEAIDNGSVLIYGKPIVEAVGGESVVKSIDLGFLK